MRSPHPTPMRYSHHSMRYPVRARFPRPRPAPPPTDIPHRHSPQIPHPQILLSSPLLSILWKRARKARPDESPHLPSHRRHQPHPRTIEPGSNQRLRQPLQHLKRSPSIDFHRSRQLFPNPIAAHLRHQFWQR